MDVTANDDDFKLLRTKLQQIACFRIYIYYIWTMGFFNSVTQVTNKPVLCLS